MPLKIVRLEQVVVKPAIFAIGNLGAHDSGGRFRLDLTN